MAEFCKQCAEEMRFEPDFTNMFKERNMKPDGDIGFGMLCEGCGPAHIVDDAGTCGSYFCDKQHGGRPAR